MANHLENFGHYRLSDRLAVGGMAEVYLASIHGEAGFTKKVVIKRLHQRYCEDEAFVQMFIDEARLTSQLHHGNICQVLDLGSVDGHYFMAMEFIAGEDLRTLQDHSRRADIPLPVDSAVYIITEVLSGLDYAHRKRAPDESPLGIIHRDVSPQNILISYEGEVKIIDFGIAKAKSRLVKTEAGVIKGKYRYMSPEQASGRKLDARTDIFAAGVVLYELLLGEPHSRDLPDPEILFRIRKADFPPLRQRRPEVPGELERLVFRALRRKPRERYPSANDFRLALLQFLQARNARLGRNELSALMYEIFDADRRQRRSGNWSLQDKRSALDAVPTRSLAGHRPRYVHAPREQAGVTDEEPTQAVVTLDEADLELLEDDGEPPGGEPPTGEPPGGQVPAETAPSAPRRVRGGSFSLRPEATDVGSKPKVARHVAQATADARADVISPDRREPTQVTRRPPSAGLRTLLGVLLVLAMGAGAVLALTRWGGILLPGGMGGDEDAGAAPEAGPRPDAGQGRLRIQSKPPRATISLCGEPTGKVTPAALQVQAGKPCELVLSLPGREPYRMPVEVAAGKSVTISATLRRARRRPRRPRPAPAAGDSAPKPRPRRARSANTGTLRVTSIQPGTVEVDGRTVGKTPRLELKLRPGTYRVRVRFARGGGSRQVVIQKGRTTRVHIDPEL
jgi:serine/threonine-protein kinase